MFHDVKTREDILVEEALEDLLSLSGKSQKPEVKQIKKVIVEKTPPVMQPLRANSPNTPKPTGLMAAVQNARARGQEMNKDMWHDPDRACEEAYRAKLKAQNKSEYDSDVLRKRILERQAAKRALDNPLTMTLANYKKTNNNDNDLGE